MGSAHIRVVMCEYNPRDNDIRFFAVIKTKSAGLKNGHITNPEEVAHSIREALAEATKVAGQKPTKAMVAVGGIGLSTYADSGSVAVSRADKEVTEFDVNRILTESEIRAGSKHNSKVIHTIPAEFKIDGKKVLGKPLGLKGNKLEIKTLFLTASKSHLNDLVKAVEESGVEVEDVFISPVAESMVTLSTNQKSAGCVLCNIGAESVTLLTFEDGLPTSLAVFPLGSTDITNDIALGLKVSLEEAEELKRRYSYHDDRRLQKKVSEIIEARLSDIFELIDTHLRKIGRSNLLPAGIVFTGEGAHIENIEVLAKDKLNLPARVAENALYRESAPGGVKEDGESKARPSASTSAKQRERSEKIKSPEWSAAYGLCILGLDMESEESIGIRIARKTKNKFFSFIRQFLP